MITPSHLYWITRLDRINEALLVLFTLSFMALFAAAAAFANGVVDEDEESKRIGRRWMPRAVLAVCVIGALRSLVPTTREAAAIVVVPRIANSETVATLDEGLKTLVAEWIEELRPERKGAGR